MAAWAVCFLAVRMVRAFGSVAVSSLHARGCPSRILGRSHRFHVVGIDTRSVAAQMIEMETWRYGTD